MVEQYTATATRPDTVAWPPRIDTTHDRAKGFYPALLSNNEALQWFAEDLRDQHSTTAASYTRLSVRSIASPALLSAMEYLLQPSGIQVEAAIPLEGQDEPLVVAYLGSNTSDRTLSQESTRHHHTTLDSAETRPRKYGADTRGIHIEFIDHETPETRRRALAPRFAGIYALFGYSEEDTQELLIDPANVIAYTQDQEGTVISTAMAAYESPCVDGVEIPMVEVTEAFTDPAYRGQGLYRAVSSRLLEYLTSASAPVVSVIYGESNLAMPGVVYAAHENGRRFVRDDRTGYGITNPNFGILPQAYRIEDGGAGPGQQPYSDLAVSYVPMEHQR